MADHALIAIAAFSILLLTFGIWKFIQLVKFRAKSTASDFPIGLVEFIKEPTPSDSAPPNPVALEVTQKQAKRERIKSALQNPQECERLVCLLERHDKVIQSNLAGVYITLLKCFEDLGFLQHRTSSLDELVSLLKEGIPGVLCIDYQFQPNILRDISRKAYQFPELRKSIFVFYNVPRDETPTPPPVLPHLHFLGTVFSSQQVTDLLSQSYKFEETSEPSTDKESGAVFEGIITEHTLVELLQFLEVGKKTGLLSVENEQPAGVINFEGGEISFAQTHLQEGAEAVFEILSISQGKFHFFPGKPQGGNQDRFCVTELLMHWVHRVDETGEMLARQESDEFNLPS